MRRLLSFALLATLASACASVPKASLQLDQQARQFKAAPGKANLYVFRDENFGAAVKMTVLLDGQYLGDTAAKTCLYTPIVPGKHTLISKTEADSTIFFSATDGQNVYVWQEVKMGVMSARSELHLLEEGAARPRVEACTMSETHAPVETAPAPVPVAAPVPNS